jgi:predicted TIM-barrel enzyme
MSLYRTVFRQRHALLPVIHVASREQALRNAAVARSAACDGIFLINHGIAFQSLVTTSGPGTGIAALREKIARMKAALGDFPLAIASGITPENVTDYLDVADCFLVATGISRDFWELDPLRVQALVEAVK